MSIDPQVALPASVALSLLSILSQVVTHFTKGSENGNKKQIELNSKKIEQLDGDISRIDLDTRSILLKLAVIEEQVKSNVLEILNLRPRLHVMTNELMGVRGDVARLVEEDKERRRRENP